MSETAVVEKQPLYKLIVDAEYQRPPSKDRIEKIAADWTPALAGVLEVSKRPDGSFAVVDGQHRLLAMKKLNITEWWVKINDLTLAEEAETFVKLQTKRRTVSPYDQHRALLAARDETAISIETVLREFGLKFIPNNGRAILSDGHGIRSLNTITRAYKNGGTEHLRKVIETPLKAWPEERPSEVLQRSVIMGLDLFYRTYPAISPKELAHKLSFVTYAKLIRDAAVLAPHSGGSASGMSQIMIQTYNHGRKSGRVEAKPMLTRRKAKAAKELK